MYAIVEAGGRQYRVSPGDRIDVEKLTGAVGDTVTLTPVLMVGDGATATIGTPQVAEARVEAQIVAQKRGRKIIIFKHKRRKGYRRKQGHRQWLTSLKILGIHTAEAGATAEVNTTEVGVTTAGDATEVDTAEVDTAEASVAPAPEA